MASNLCPRCQSRCVVTTALQKVCLACGEEQGDLPMWLTTAPGASLLPAQIADRLDATEDDEERRA